VDESKIASLKATHGNTLLLVTAGDGTEAVFKKPTRASWTRFREGLAGGNSIQASNDLLRDTLVHPSWEELTAIFDRFPALENDFAKEVSELAKAENKVSAKKL
jgi:hypothetical protein